MSTPRKRPSARLRPLALGHVRVSTADQVENGASLDAQRTTLIGEADRRGWDFELVADEGLSGKNMRTAPRCRPPWPDSTAARRTP